MIEEKAQSLNGLEHEDVEWYRQRITDLEAELREVRSLLRLSDDTASNKKFTNNSSEACENFDQEVILDILDQKQQRNDKEHSEVTSLSVDSIERYSRQLLLENGFGVEGQLVLLNSAVLVVGAGGIGSSALLYLGAFGVGRIGIIDFDRVEMSNLHRQVIHTNEGVGSFKAESARKAIIAINPTIECSSLNILLTADNAMDVISDYDVVIDASDNPVTRYLVNDACILLRKPLISGSALGVEGQFTVHNYKNGPCYRCLYPKPSLSAGCVSCSDAGVLGPVPGLIGILQAIETVKVLTGLGTTMHDRILIYDGLQCSFRSIKKPPKQPKCPVCSKENSTIHTMEDCHKNLVNSRGPSVSPLCLFSANSTERDRLDVTCLDYKEQIIDLNIPHVLLDVRAKRQFDLCALNQAINIPLSNLVDKLDVIETLSDGTKPIYCICRRGIASAEATRILSQAILSRPKIHSVRNIRGGLAAWQQDVDNRFPKY